MNLTAETLGHRVKSVYIKDAANYKARQIHVRPTIRTGHDRANVDAGIKAQSATREHKPWGAAPSGKPGCPELAF